MLTVGVPVYNAEKFLSRCLQNLCAEDLDFRVVIADNASTDQTESIARDFASRDPRLTYIRHETNLGPMVNFRSLLDNAQTELFAWRAYDDVSSPDYFTKLSQALVDSPSGMLAVGAVAYEDSDGNPPQDRTVPATLSDDLVQRRRELLKHVSAAWIYGVFRREELTKRFYQVNQAYDYMWGGDMLMLLPFVLSGSICTVPQVSFKQHLSSQSAQAFRPQGVIQPVRMVCQFARYGFKCADELAASRRDRWSQYRQVLRYTDGGAEKFGRIAKRAAFWPYYRLRGRL